MSVLLLSDAAQALNDRLMSFSKDEALPDDLISALSQLRRDEQEAIRDRLRQRWRVSALDKTLIDALRRGMTAEQLCRRFGYSNLGSARTRVTQLARRLGVTLDRRQAKNRGRIETTYTWPADNQPEKPIDKAATAAGADGISATVENGNLRTHPASLDQPDYKSPTPAGPTEAPKNSPALTPKLKLAFAAIERHLACGEPFTHRIIAQEAAVSTGTAWKAVALYDAKLAAEPVTAKPDLRAIDAKLTNIIQLLSDLFVSCNLCGRRLSPWEGARRIDAKGIERLIHPACLELWEDQQTQPSDHVKK